MTTDQAMKMASAIEYALGTPCDIDSSVGFQTNLTTLLDVREMADGSGSYGIFVYGTERGGFEAMIRTIIDPAGNYENNVTYLSSRDRNLHHRGPGTSLRPGSLKQRAGSGA
jgi:hypothetical protein